MGTHESGDVHGPVEDSKVSWGLKLLVAGMAVILGLMIWSIVIAIL
nr:hypothetical protein [Anaerolineae bacterium]